MAAASLALPSCSDNDYTELDKGSVELALTADKAETVLSEQNHAVEAIALSWTTGTNHGTGNRISYTLELAEAGTGFANPHIIKEAEQQVYSWKPTVEELNTLVRSQFGTLPGEALAIEARITAAVTGFDDVQTSVTQFTVTPYEPVTPTLYLIGDATPNGWAADNASEMTRSDNGVFTWTGNLSPGNFKFITTLGQFLPSYNNNGNGQLVYRTSDDQPDLQFNIEEAHCYKVDVNLLDLTITYTQTEGVVPPYDQLFSSETKPTGVSDRCRRTRSTRSCSASGYSSPREGNSSSEQPKVLGKTCTRRHMPMPPTPTRQWNSSKGSTPTTNGCLPPAKPTLPTKSALTYVRVQNA